MGTPKVKRVKCIIDDLNSTNPPFVKSIGILYDANEPIIMKITGSYMRANYQFSSASSGAAIAKDMYSDALTFFGKGDGLQNGPARYTNGELFDYYYSDRYTVHFPGGYGLGVENYNGSHYMTYATPTGTARVGEFPSRSALGIAGCDEYEYVNKSGVHTRAIMSPRIFPFIKTINNEDVYRGSFCALDVTNNTEYYPHPILSVADDANSNDVANYERKAAIIREFTTHVLNTEAIYLVVPVVGAGGSVRPSHVFWSNAMRPCMFTVTPDEHHAIHSVNAYRVDDNQQIPLQESDMDLLTGAKSYIFNMPSADVNVVIEFRSIEIAIPVTVKYTSPRGKVFTTSFNLLYDDVREETTSPVEE